MCEHCIDVSLMCPSHILLNLTSSNHMTFFPLLHSPIFMLPKNHLFPISLSLMNYFFCGCTAVWSQSSHHIVHVEVLLIPPSLTCDVTKHLKKKKKNHHKIDSPLLSFQIFLTYWTGLSVIVACFLSLL